MESMNEKRVSLTEERFSFPLDDLEEEEDEDGDQDFGCSLFDEE